MGVFLMPKCGGGSINLFELAASISLDDSGFLSGITRATGLGATFGKTVSSNVQKVTASFSDMISIAAGIKIVTSAFDSLSSSIGSAMGRIDTMEQFERTMTVLTGSSQKAGEALETIRTKVTGTAYGLDVAASAVQNFVTSGVDIEVAADQIGTLADAVSFYGDGTNATLESVSNAWAKMATSGKVSANEINTLTNAGIPVYKIYADAVGQSVEDVKKSLSSGAVSAEEFQAALSNAMKNGTESFKAIEGAAQEAGASWKGTLDNFKAYSTRGVVSIIEAIDSSLEALNLPDMRAMIKAFGLEIEKSLNLAADGITVLIGNAGEGLQGIYESFRAGDFEGVGNSITDVFTSIVETINSKVPEFINSAVTIVKAFLSGLTDNSGAVFDGGVKLYKSILDGVREVIPSILPLVGDIASTFVQAFIEKQSLLYEVGFQILTAVVEGIAENIEIITESTLNAINRVLEIINENLPLFLAAGIEIITGIIEGISKNVDGIVETASKIIATLLKGLTAALPEIAKSAIQIITKLSTELTKNLPEIIAAGFDALLALAEGIADALPELIPAALETVLTFVIGLLDNIDKLVDAAIELMMGLADGLIDALPILLDKAPEIIVKLMEAIIENAPKLFVASVEIIVKLVEGIVKAFPDLIAAALEIILELKAGIIRFAFKMRDAGLEIVGKIKDAVLGTNWIQLGKDIVSGIANGITSGASSVINAAKDLASNTLQGVKDFFIIESPSKRFRDEVGKMLPLGMAEGIDANAKVAKKSAETLSKEVFTQAKLWMDDYQLNSKYLASTELELWKELREQYSDLSKERVDIDKKINALEENLLKERQAQESKAFESTKTLYNFRKTLGLMTVQDEYKAYKELSEVYIEGSEAQKSAAKMAEQAQKEIASEVNAIVKEMQSIEEDYQNTLDNRAQTIYNSFGLFDELKEKEEVSGKTLIDNLRAQVEELGSWADNIQALADKGINKGLLAELEAMGPSANAKIAALVNLTDYKLDEYVELWQDKQRLAREIATEELTDLRQETDRQLSDLVTSAEDLIGSGAYDAGASLVELLKNGALDNIPQLKPLAWEIESQLLDSLSELDGTGIEIDGLGEMFQESTQIMDEYSEMIGDKTNKAKELALIELEDLKTESVSGIETMMTSILSIIEQMAYPSGKLVMERISQGMADKLPELLAQAESIARQIINKINSTMGTMKIVLPSISGFSTDFINFDTRQSTYDTSSFSTAGQPLVVNQYIQANNMSAYELEQSAKATFEVARWAL